MSLRHRIGALIYDWPRYHSVLRSGQWELMRNRDEQISTDGRGVHCEWRFTSDLHIANVFPPTGRRLMSVAFAQWPVISKDAPERAGDRPDVSFVIGHRGIDRLPLLQQTLRSIAGQSGVDLECIVVEQAAQSEVLRELPPWCRYLFSECHTDYNRAAAFNAGARVARAPVVILHDNDIVVPAHYAREIAARAAEGFDFIDVKRFLFHLDARGELASIMQNAQGGSIAARRTAYFDIGGFDEEFVGWGGEDNDFWDRAESVGKAYRFGYLPLIHLHHPPQRGKLDGAAAPAVQRYRELETIAPEERIRRLRQRLRP